MLSGKVSAFQIRPVIHIDGIAILQKSLGEMTEGSGACQLEVAVRAVEFVFHEITQSPHAMRWRLIEPMGSTPLPRLLVTCD